MSDGEGADFSTEDVGIAMLAAAISQIDGPFTEEEATEAKMAILVQSLTNIINDPDPAERVARVRRELATLVAEFRRREEAVKKGEPVEP